MASAFMYLWAKTRTTGAPEWHPLLLHLLDVAAAADAILDREPEATRQRMGEVLGLPLGEARPWLLFAIACHDLGKACPGFQSKWPEQLASTGLRLPRNPDTSVLHGVVSQIALDRLLQDRGWPAALAELVSDAVGCHHGERAAERAKEKATQAIHVGSGERLRAVRQDWEDVRNSLVAALTEVFPPTRAPSKPTLSGPDFMLLAGLTSFADWIGSNEEWFTFGQPRDCEDPLGWFRERRAVAEKALAAIGWEPRTPLSARAEPFAQVFGNMTPRPLQVAVEEILPELDRPAVLLVEAPMGEGKTEAAFFAHLELQRRFGHRGLYVALPTKATGNAMFGRTLEFLQKQDAGRRLDLQLLHGAKTLNEQFQKLRLARIYDETADGEVRAAEWFTNKKRALLSEYGVGTVDQALVPILPVRHNFVRLWGLANRVVILDEIHAYDGYTGTLLLHLVSWLQALGASVIMLSATLSPTIRRRLAEVTGSQLPEQEEAYPRLSVFLRGEPVRQRHVEATPDRRVVIRLLPLGTDLPMMAGAIEERLTEGGMGLALVNTVQRAQALFQLFPEGEPLIRQGVRIGKTLADGTQILLFHARFPSNQRQVREEAVLDAFGPAGSREGRKILIATQVAEQSLDLDFDLMVTDLAPIDLLLQRAGRLWRHRRPDRPVGEATLIVAGLAGDIPPSFGNPLWWEKVYREDLLLRTWILLRANDRPTVTLPDDIDGLVRAVYEDQVPVPMHLMERMEKAVEAAEGKAIAQRQLANLRIIGFPDDASWNDPARFVFYDEDALGVHRTLMAQTRLGEDSVVVIPMWPDDAFRAEATPDQRQATEWYLRGVSLSRKGVVDKLRAQGVPAGWQESPLLRGCLPLRLDATGCWERDPKVRLDEDLGVVYEAKEKESE